MKPKKQQHEFRDRHYFRFYTNDYSFTVPKLDIPFSPF